MQKINIPVFCLKQNNKTSFLILKNGLYLSTLNTRQKDYRVWALSCANNYLDQKSEVNKN